MLLKRWIGSLTALCLLMLLAVVARGQDSTAPTSPDVPEETDPLMPDSDGGSELTLESVEAALKEIQEGGLDDLAKQSISSRYKEAIESLKSSAKFRALEAQYREALDSGPSAIESVKSQLAALPDLNQVKLPGSLDRSSSVEEIDDVLTKEQAALGKLKSELSGLEDDLAVLADRPLVRRERLLEVEVERKSAEAELEKTESEVSGEATASQEAEIVRLKALIDMLGAEAAMLEQEGLSEKLRQSLKQANRELTTKKIEQVGAVLVQIKELESQRVDSEILRTKRLIKTILEGVESPSEFLSNLLEQAKTNIAAIQEVNAKIETLEEQQQEREEKIKQVTGDFNQVKQQIDIDAFDGSMGQLIMEQINRLPDRRVSYQNLARLKGEISTARRSVFELDRKLRAIQSDEGESEIPSDLSQYQDKIEQLIGAIDEMESDLLVSNRRWLRRLGQLELAERKLLQTSNEFRMFLVEKFFWVRSSLPLGPSQLGDVPDGLRYCFGTGRLQELRDRLSRVPIWFYLIAGAATILLVIGRPYFHRRLRITGRYTKRISSDRYGYTLSALFFTLLLSIPASLLLTLFGWVLIRQPDASGWSYGLGLACMTSSWFLFQVSFLINSCRKGGLAEAHFGWEPRILRRMSRLSFWLIPLYLLPMIILRLTLNEPGLQYLGGLSRLAVIALALGGGVILALLLHPGKGVAASVHRHAPGMWFGRLRLLWFLVSIAHTILLVTLALIGYVITSIILVGQFSQTVTTIMVAFLLYGMIYRLVSLRERKLALEEAKTARKERQEANRRAAAGGAEDESSNEEAFLPEIQEDEVMNLTEVCEQSRRLIGFFVSAGVLIMLLVIWTRTVPVLEVLDRASIFGGFSLADLLIVGFAIVIMVGTVRNLPGLLEVVLLRRINVDAGSRNAIVTLAKYFVVTVGSIYVFNHIGIDWAQFGWIAAALGVGIGFGLQEVVANFISGIILLFERPVRVGDVVTVDGVDGVVSRIRIRATTITNWNRQELIIPNKNFITGTVLNWTLTSSVNRIVITVGVAYGCDTDKARQLLLKAAKEHPGILEDPAPVASFEGFDDSSLRLLLRCYIPSLDNRLQTITELHTEIDRLFKEESIEIPFPQRDLHLRSTVKGGIG